MYKKHTVKKAVIYSLAAAALLLAGSCLKAPENAQASAKIKISKQVFPEKELREIAVSYDKNEDGMLSKAEIGKIKSLSIRKFLDPDDVDMEVDGDRTPLHYKKSDFVFDFQGIGHFTSLKKLEINLSGGVTQKEGKHYPSVLSHFDEVYKLKKLKTFDLYSAKQKSIDLSKFPKLKKADLSDISNLSQLNIHNQYLETLLLSKSTGKLKSINFKNAPKLRMLSLEQMQDTQLIFGKQNNVLQDLSIYGNTKKKSTKMKSLDITDLKNLKKITLQKINTSQVDFSKNVNLEDVYIDKCSMETLDFSNNKKITWLACEGKKTKEIVLPEDNIISTFKWVNAGLDTFENERLNPDTLTSIILFANEIQSLDLTHYKKLSFVFVDKNVDVQLDPELNAEEIVTYD